jgi:ligand-binding SRPBCC domain-containing protein
MGQTTNPNIFRLGKKKEWKSKYIEKKTGESSAIIFQDSEIQKFIYQLFWRHQLKVHAFRTYYSEKTLHFYISYYNLAKPQVLERNSTLQHKIFFSKSFRKKLSKINARTAKNKFYKIKCYQKEFLNKNNLFQSQYLLEKKSQRLTGVKKSKNYTNSLTYTTLNHENANLFVSKIFKAISLFTQKRCDIFLNLNQLNTETQILQQISKKTKQKVSTQIMTLRKFQENGFFEHGINILYNFTLNPHDPTFLAKFVGYQLKRLKRQNFFLRFLKTTLMKFIRIFYKFSKLSRIQIEINGRFNRAPRSKKRIIRIGKAIPVSTLNANINYGESVAYGSNGTFGIKVWTCINNKKL